MVKIMEIRLPHYGRGYHLITQELLSRLPQLPENGLLNLFIKHTSAALTINENADPDVRLDFEAFFDRIVPDGVFICVSSVTAEGLVVSPLRL